MVAVREGTKKDFLEISCTVCSHRPRFGRTGANIDRIALSQLLPADLPTLAGICYATSAVIKLLGAKLLPSLSSRHPLVSMYSLLIRYCLANKC